MPWCSVAGRCELLGQLSYGSRTQSQLTVGPDPGSGRPEIQHETGHARQRERERDIREPYRVQAKSRCGTTAAQVA